MTNWSNEINEELASLIKDWLKLHGKTQADLSKKLQAISTRMPALLEVLEREYLLGGLPKVAARLCEIESIWENEKEAIPVLESQQDDDPFGQLDLILQEIKDDYEG
ncbi:hypothetical protein [Prochlorococcus sp. MIT 1341]|uniref:hypothetical protein n=1 Tax=Prochlorococcus sp. MIT 1341 TaxID=3096221 RepID=UPI002A751A14|nr:hypothetical protein [Prochlorococcus sp. MIT 1341]